MARRYCVVFDCDGVLLDSNAMKCDAFREVLQAYPVAATEPFLDFQKTAFGKSRFRLFDLFFADYLRRPANPGERDALLEGFGAICGRDYVKQPITPGALVLLEELDAAGVPMFVASGSAEEELRDTLARLPLGRFFAAIYGSPATKQDNLARIRSQVGLDVEILFVGDAEADFRAAIDAGTDFIYMSEYAAAPQAMAELKAQHGFDAIGGLGELLDVRPMLAPQN